MRRFGRYDRQSPYYKDRFRDNRNYKSRNRKYDFITTLVTVLVIGAITIAVYLFIGYNEQDDNLIMIESNNVISKNYKQGFSTMVTEISAEEAKKEEAKKEDTTKTETPSTATPDTANNSLIKVVNKKNSVPADYVPDTVEVSVRGTRTTYLRKEASDALTQMFSEADTAGHTLYACSGYRSYETQSGLYQSNVDTLGVDGAELVSARPGMSEHQLGLAMDVTSSAVGYDLLESFGSTSEGKWVAENAASYGFIIRYENGKTGITGYAYEPWHLRYVGVDVAKAIKSSGKTMEEYYGILGV